MELLDERTPRDNATRETEERPSDAWVPQSILPTPNESDGWKYRWVRIASYNQADDRNASRRLREGWEPVRAEDHPELQVMSDLNVRKEFRDCVVIGGLLLCRCPTEQVNKRNAYYSEKAQNQMKAVDQNYMKQNDPRMPLLDPERKTRTEFRRG